MRASLALGFAAALVSLVTGCSGTVTGTGGSDPTNGGNGSSTSSDGSQSTNESGGAQLPSTGTTGNGSPSTDPGTPSAYDALFDAPTTSTATPDKLTGLWAGTKNGDDIRIQISSSKVVIAMRCGSSPAAGVDVVAQNTSSAIKIVASKMAGAEYSPCGIKVTPVSIPACTETKDIGCFTLSDMTLSFEGVWLFSSGGYGPDPTFTKLSD